MRCWKLIAAGVIFIALTAMKLCLPEQTQELRQTVMREIARDAGYEAAIAGLGALLTDRAESTTATVKDNDPLEDGAILKTDAVLSEVLLPVAAISSPEPSEPPEAVAVFLKSQEEFSDFEVPANVAYEMPELPFEYACPVKDCGGDGFGYRVHPIDGDVKFHYGTDFPVWSGADVRAFAYGLVSMSGWDAGYGNYIIVDHGGGWSTLYAHCGTVFVTCGQSVALGDKLALAGATGEVTGPHLHFELRCDGVYYNPEFWLA